MMRNVVGGKYLLFWIVGAGIVKMDPRTTIRLLSLTRLIDHDLN
jgi:hypothetical protein